MLWTGGKDSALALHESLQSGIDVQLLVTFAPPNPQFRAHPLTIIQRQAQSLNIPHDIYTITGSPIIGYRHALQSLQEKGMDTVITGDIDLVDRFPNWIDTCCQSLNIRVLKPLWQKERTVLCEKLFAQNFDVVITCVNTKMLSPSFVGRRFSKSLIIELEKSGVDICGENGEFHTMTTNMPHFTTPLQFGKYDVRQEGEYAFMAWPTPPPAPPPPPSPSPCLTSHRTP